MTVVELSPDSVLPERTNYDLQIERDPTFTELVKSNFYNENLMTVGSEAISDNVNSLLHTVSNKVMANVRGTEIDDAYDVYKDPRMKDGRYVAYADRFFGIESRYDAEQTFQRIDRQLEAKQTMAAGGLPGVAAAIAGTFGDPTMFIPLGGAAYKTYRQGDSILKGAARTALTTGTVVSGQELALQSLQETRTGEESAWNIAGATFLGGVVGTAASAFGGRKAFDDLGKRVEEELSAARFGTSVGAAEAPTTTLKQESLKSAAGLDKLMSFQDPLLRMANSPSKQARKLMENLGESTLVRNKNTDGIKTDISVENRIKGYELPKYNYMRERDRLFLDYRNAKSKMRTVMGDKLSRSRKDGMMTYQEFKEAVVKAGRRNDEHDIPQVAAAARAKRQLLTDPIFKAAKDVELIDPGTTAPTTAQSYVMRVWDQNAIKSDPQGFREANTSWLRQKRDRAAAELDKTFKELELDADSRVAAAVEAERASLREAAKATKQIKKKAEKAGDGANKAQESARLSIDQLESRVKDATKNQQRIYSKILNKRERGDADLRDLFNEFRTVSTAKKELYKRLAIKGEKAEASGVEMIRRQEIADYMARKEADLQAKLDQLEDNVKIMEDLEYRASFDDDDLYNVAYKLTDRILGTSVGRLSYDNKIRTGKSVSTPGKRGPAKARVYDIPDELVEKYLINDDDVLTESYVRSLASDIELTKTFGSIDPEDALKQIQDDYATLEFGINDPEVIDRLRKAKNADLRDFKAVWERLRGTFDNGNGDDYASGWRSTERMLMNMNYLAMLGGMTLSAFSDVARPVMTHGLTRVMGDGLKPLMTDFAAFKAAASDVKETGVGLDMVGNTRARALMGLDEFAPFQNRAEAITGAMSQQFGVASLMAPWNAAAKQFTGVITQNRMMKSIKALAAGKEIAAKETEYLAANFIDKSMAKKIAAQFEEFGEATDSVLIPNARNWKDIEAAEAFRAAIRKQVDQIIVTPGQDKPLWMSKSGWRLMGQFRSFSVASMQRTMLAGLQQRDAAVLNGVALAVTLGAMSYVTKSKLGKYETDTSVSRLIREGVDRSGVLAWLVDANQVTEKLSRGRIGINAIMGGPPLSRYASRSALEAVFGPSYGMAGNMVQVAGNALAGDWQSSDTHTVRRMMPYNNLFYLNTLFDEAENGINGALGVKPK
jgi:hypothetical protein